MKIFNGWLKCKLIINLLLCRNSWTRTVWDFYLFIIIIVEEYHLISHMVPKEYGDKKSMFSSKLNKIISFFIY